MPNSIDELIITETGFEDLRLIADIHTATFGSDEEATLTLALLEDETAQPVLSLIARLDNIAVGHILFTKVTFENVTESPNMYILAPLAVIPEYQGMSIGGSLINKGIEILKARSTALVFVLGHESYYPKFGFKPNAEHYGFEAPYPIPNQHKDAWMVHFLDNAHSKNSGLKVKCAKQMDNPKYWEE